MKHTPQSAIDLINHDITAVMRSPLFGKVAEQTVQRFVQAKIDALVKRGHLDTTLEFTVSFDQKKGQYMAFLAGSF